MVKKAVRKQEEHRRFLMSADLRTGDTWWVNRDDGELAFCINLTPVLKGRVEKNSNSFRVGIKNVESVSTDLISNPDSMDYQPGRIDFRKLTSDRQVDVFVRGYCLLIETLSPPEFRSFHSGLEIQTFFLLNSLKTPPEVSYKIFQSAQNWYESGARFCPPEHTQSFPNLIFPDQSK